jgi:hypothetical protein
MLTGGRKTSIPKAMVVEEPYDSLSFVPTVLALTGNLRDDSNPIPALWKKGFRRFPGHAVREVLRKPEVGRASLPVGVLTDREVCPAKYALACLRDPENRG